MEAFRSLQAVSFVRKVNPDKSKTLEELLPNAYAAHGSNPSLQSGFHTIALTFLVSQLAAQRRGQPPAVA